MRRVRTSTLLCGDRCQTNDHFWIGLGSVTGAKFNLVVEDTLSGQTRSLSNPGVGNVTVDNAAFGCP